MRDDAGRRVVLVCAPFLFGAAPPVRGSVTDTCADCGCVVWVSPEGVECAQRRRIAYRCMACCLTSGSTEIERDEEIERCQAAQMGQDWVDAAHESAQRLMKIAKRRLN